MDMEPYSDRIVENMKDLYKRRWFVSKFRSRNQPASLAGLPEPEPPFLAEAGAVFLVRLRLLLLLLLLLTGL